MARTPFVSVEVRGAADPVEQLAADFDRDQRRIQDRLNREMRALDRELVPIYQRFAPRDTGRLSRGIESAISFRARAVTVTVGGEARRDGFDYLPITRFGHDQRIIRPRRAKALKVHVDGRGSRPTLMVRVKGSRPKFDWVELASVAAEGLVRAHTERLNREIHLILLDSGR